MSAVLNAPWIARQATDLLAQRGHAWLLQGPSGLGQYELALAMVSAWLCEQPSAQGACGDCPSCHAIAVHTHADLAVLMPETVMLDLGWPLSEKAQDEIDKKTRKPSKEIRVDAMRDAVEFSQRTDARGRGKAVLVFPAERMNTVTANALLKTLEEPPGDVRFVMATEASHMLLPTIRSRCLAHTMKWPEADEGMNWLTGQGLPAPMATALLRSAGGRPTDVLRQAEAGLSPDWWDALPKAMRQGDARHLADLSPAQAIDALQKLCHDLVLRQAGATPRFFEAGQLPNTAASLSALTDWFKRLMQSARTAEHPFNAGLMLEALTADAQQTLLSRG
ncbi:DNA polymerase III subunit delta' [Limnohabitans sp. T6-5]|uniref:DNA polymerase III subunit delta' n=1 Tax=Limnohabitans sp. T6-5 TaxID=1100724 RepID=UPI000D33180D|nr:DNA polymerase III subunit delta' [Limnohabitans sp. T6-5]PUE08722.1 DNA polymerase III subunit delta' [Limnohabitans sp. T6-5]